MKYGIVHAGALSTPLSTTIVQINATLAKTCLILGVCTLGMTLKFNNFILDVYGVSDSRSLSTVSELSVVEYLPKT